AAGVFRKKIRTRERCPGNAEDEEERRDQCADLYDIRHGAASKFASALQICDGFEAEGKPAAAAVSADQSAFAVQHAREHLLEKHTRGQYGLCRNDQGAIQADEDQPEPGQGVDYTGGRAGACLGLYQAAAAPVRISVSR